MNKYVVKFLQYPSTDDIEKLCNDMYTNSYKLVSTILEECDCTVYFIFELDEVERRCN